MLSFVLGVVIFLGLSLYTLVKVRKGISRNLLIYAFIGIFLSLTWTYYSWHARECETGISCEDWEEDVRQHSYSKRFPIKYSVFTDSGWDELQ